MRLLLATQNQGKVRELHSTLASLGLKVIGLSDLGLQQADEVGESFFENARQKALSAAKQSGEWALAEDSGLEVAALKGAPGVYSARYAGDGAVDDENNGKLLAELAGVPTDARRAQFRCVMVLASPYGRIFSTEGTCRGYIATTPRGTQGFGYDPLFVPEGHERTFGEMSRDEKGELSHRAQALSAMVQTIKQLR